MRSTAGRVQTRPENKQAVYRFILSHESATRQELCVGLGLSLPTIRQSLDFLEAEELIVPSDIIRNTGGRNAVAYRISTTGHYAVGIYLSLNHISTFCIDMTGKILARDRMAVTMDIHDEFYLKRIGDCVDQAVTHAGIAPQRVLGVGIAVPSLVSPDHESIVFGMTHDFTGITRSVLSRYISYPTRMFHDSYIAGYPEVWKSPRFKNAVFLSLNGSIGASLIIDHRLYNGDHQRAGEIGHLIMKPGTGRRCCCGNIGCLDTLCSTTVLSSCADGSLDRFFFLLKSGDEKAASCWAEYTDELTLAIHNLRMLYDCNIIIGGYISTYISDFMEDLYTRIDAMDIFYVPARTYVFVSEYSIDSAALGAAIQITEDYISAL